MSQHQTARPVKVFVEDIKDGEKVKTVFLVKFKATPVKKNGEPYINLVLVDRSGEIESKVWDNARELDKRFAKNDFVFVEGVAGLYQGKIQLRVENVTRVEDSTVAIADFLPVSASDREVMWDETRRMLEGVKNRDLKRLLKALMADEKLMERYRRAPAAKEIHHPYIGGLMEHSLNVMKLADSAASLYPMVDRDLLIVGAFLHDIGKTRELSYDRAFDYTDEGRMVGHIVFGVEILDEKLPEARVQPDLAMHLKHIILSHHGALEFGSPKRPKTIEALAIAAFDDLDARVNSWNMIFAKEPGDRWTSYQKLYERYLFKGRVPDGGQDEPEEPAAAAAEPKERAADRPHQAHPKKGHGKGYQTGDSGDLKFNPFTQISLLGGNKNGGRKEE